MPSPNLGAYDDNSSGEESGERDDQELLLFGATPDESNTRMGRAKEFLRSSEALTEFYEGLLDFRIAKENSTRNRINAVLRRRAILGLTDGILQWVPGKTIISEFLWRIRWSAALSIPRRIFRSIRRAVRSSVKPGTGRIEWTCECGKELYADFSTDDRIAFLALQAALQGNIITSTAGSDALSNTVSSAQLGILQDHDYTPVLFQRAHATRNIGHDINTTGTHFRGSANQQDDTAQYLAVCTPAGGIYNCLNEINVANMKSDTELFLAVKSVYCASRKPISQRKFLLKPIGVEFIHFNVWDNRKGYISICDRPECVPPQDDPAYESTPRPLKPLPPVPPEIFVHYLEHDAEKYTSSRFIWTPRLPKRKGNRLIDCDIPTYGWGIYIKEGPNRLFVFWMVIVSAVLSIVLSLLWAGLKGDVQGASGLGTLVLGIHSVVMVALMFKFGN